MTFLYCFFLYWALPSAILFLSFRTSSDYYSLMVSLKWGMFLFVSKAAAVAVNSVVVL